MSDSQNTGGQEDPRFDVSLSRRQASIIVEALSSYQMSKTAQRLNNATEDGVESHATLMNEVVDMIDQFDQKIRSSNNE